jgi:hypothetical protein
MATGGRRGDGGRASTPSRGRRPGGLRPQARRQPLGRSSWRGLCKLAQTRKSLIKLCSFEKSNQILRRARGADGRQVARKRAAARRPGSGGERGLTITSGQPKYWLGGLAFFPDGVPPTALMAFTAPTAFPRTRRSSRGWGAHAAGSCQHDGSGRGAGRRNGSVAYRVTARRESPGPYAALCSSTHARAGAAWLLIAHQQTPAG